LTGRWRTDPEESQKTLANQALAAARRRPAQLLLTYPLRHSARHDEAITMRSLLTQLSAVAALCLPLASQAFVLGPTSPGKWGPPAMGTGATVSYSFMGDGVSCAQEFVGCTNTSFATLFSGLPGWQTEVQDAFSAWSAVANITFIQVADDGAAFNAPTSSGDIRLGAHVFNGPGGVLAHGYYPPVNGGSAAGDIHFDVAEAWKIGFGGAGFDLFQVLAHEIGHAIGLDHTGVAGSLMNPFYTEAFAGAQADDIAGARFIYGRAVQHNVPEPAGLFLFGLALTAALAARRRA
jgi:hypothetical protein